MPEPIDSDQDMLLSLLVPSRMIDQLADWLMEHLRDDQVMMIETVEVGGPKVKLDGRVERIRARAARTRVAVVCTATEVDRIVRELRAELPNIPCYHIVQRLHGHGWVTAQSWTAQS